MHGMLERGHSALVCPGGVRECLYMEHGREAVYLTKRTGFVRIALQHGIHPCNPTRGCIAWYKSQASFPFTASCQGGSACTWSMAGGCQPQESDWLCADSAAAGCACMKSSLVHLHGADTCSHPNHSNMLGHFKIRQRDSRIDFMVGQPGAHSGILLVSASCQGSAYPEQLGAWVRNTVCTAGYSKEAHSHGAVCRE